jgi:hypothetical protein
MQFDSIPMIFFVPRSAPDIVAHIAPHMKILVSLVLLLAPWAIFAYVAAQSQRPSTIGLVLTLAVSAFGLTLLISRNKK